MPQNTLSVLWRLCSRVWSCTRLPFFWRFRREISGEWEPYRARGAHGYGPGLTCALVVFLRCGTRVRLARAYVLFQACAHMCWHVCAPLRGPPTGFDSTGGLCSPTYTIVLVPCATHGPLIGAHPGFLFGCFCLLEPTCIPRKTVHL